MPTRKTCKNSNIAVFCGVKPCSLKNRYRRFEGRYCIASIFSRPKDESRTFPRNGSVKYPIARRHIPDNSSLRKHIGFATIFCLVDGDRVFLRNVSNDLQDYTVSYFRKQPSQNAYRFCLPLEDWYVLRNAINYVSD